MRVSISTPRLDLSNSARAAIQQRLESALDRFGPQIERISVTLTDENGPRKGRDKRCRIAVQLRTSNRVSVTDADTTIQGVVARAADRISHSVAKAIERRWQTKRVQHRRASRWMARSAS